MKCGKAVGNSIKLLLLLVLFTVCCRAAFVNRVLTFTEHLSHKSAFLSSFALLFCALPLCGPHFSMHLLLNMKEEWPITWLQYLMS